MSCTTARERRFEARVGVWRRFKGGGLESTNMCITTTREKGGGGVKVFKEVIAGVGFDEMYLRARRATAEAVLRACAERGMS